MITRQAEARDANAMCAIINPLIEQGDNTAHRTPFDPARMIAYNISTPLLVSCVLVEDRSEVLGFQCLKWADPQHEGPGKLPKNWGVIATFVGPNTQGKGVGRKLFEASKLHARKTDMVAIDAGIRADNVRGLAFYAKIGFVDYNIIKSVPIAGKGPIDRICKRFDL